MRIINLSYSSVTPPFNDPNKWLDKIIFSVGVMESMALVADIIGVYHIQFKGQMERNGVRYYFTNLSRWQLLFPLRFNLFIRDLNPDVIILHGLIFPWQVLLLVLQLRKKVKIIAQHHAEKPFQDFRKYLQRKADRYISAYLFSASELGMKWVSQKQILNASKIKIVMGTSSPFHVINKDVARASVPVRGNSNFLWVGDLTLNKDPLCALAAFCDFLNHSADAKFWMIYGSDQLEPDVKRFVELKGMKSSVFLVGRVDHDQLLNWYNSLDFIISCSHYEGSGIAVCEAMSCGCIPIVSNIPSFQMMTDGGSAGMIYKVGDSRDLLNCLLKSIQIDIEVERNKVLARFSNELSFEANSRKIMEVINQA